jgi:peptidoglycan/xylan/chitin deacetylase (PgdA/CDA1 family)/TolA-binding protein
MRKNWQFTLMVAVVAIAVTVASVWYSLHKRAPDDPQLTTSLEAITANYRRIIVLMDGASDLDAATRARCRSVGRRLFWDKQTAVEELNETLAAQPQKIRQVIDYVTSAKLRDADRLAFLDVFEELGTQKAPATGVKAELDDLHSIQNAYRAEVTRIFSQFATRGGTAVREKWSTYVSWLRTFESRDKLLKQYDDGTTDEEPASDMRGQGNPNEVSGTDFAPKTVALTFDDGPHPRYTEEVTALLRKYGIRAAFFEVGRNLGKVAKDGTVTLSHNAEISKRLIDAGHVVANHTYSHRVLVKLSESDRSSEIETTSLLLEKALGQKPQLFRPPYGARNKQILAQINGEGLKNVMWTIDSEDWADPIPESIAMRVLHELNQTHKGIILFHDIHKQATLALPLVLDELNRQGYTYLAFENTKLVKSTPPLGGNRSDDGTAAPQMVQTAAGERVHPYRQSWAVIIGVNEYQAWPKLRYAVNDANAMEQMLINKFGFKRENIIKLLDGEATRQRIMQVLGDELTNPAKVSHDDRIFFFFAGHGATRNMSENRQIGFIIPVDADKTNYYATAISMSEIREASDLIPAKHVYFVMDSCYSGLALTRGGGSSFEGSGTYLDEVTSRVARQILTAGGANQEVADDGPNGHSVFTWALLEGLDGKADLDHNGVITASELGAYVSPVVASFSHQTPVMGNLIGSEGGEFIFELQPEALGPLTQQFEGKSLELNRQLASLDSQIAAKQQELLKLQQSIRAETEKLQQTEAKTTVSSAAAATTLPAKARAYDLDRMARGYYREKKYDEAAKTLEQAVALKPNDPVLLNNLGFIYFEMGRYDDAATYLEKTLTLDPNRKEAHENLADADLKLGKKTEAKGHFERYLELYPTSPKAAEVRRILATL